MDEQYGDEIDICGKNLSKVYRYTTRTISFSLYLDKVDSGKTFFPLKKSILWDLRKVAVEGY